MENIYNRVCSVIDKITPEIAGLSAAIHSHPETAGNEHTACQLQADLLRRHGFQVETGYLEIPTAFRATYESGKPGPNLAFLSEYDALPELGHGCGHNLIAALACASGISLREFAGSLGGNVYIFGCPSEETNGAKVDMAARGAFDSMTAAFIAHPYGTDGTSSTSLAIDALQFEFFGKAAHAASCPEEGINALDAAVNTFNLINALRQQSPNTSRIHGILTDGGVCPNIIPEYACARFYVRDARRASLQKLTKRVVQCAEGAAAGCGAKLKVSHFEYSNDDLVTNQALSGLVTEKLREAGFRGPLAANINGGSSDVGNVSYRCPAIQPWFGVGNDCGLHTREFEEAAGTPEALAKALLYAKAFVLSGIALMQQPDLCETIRKEFRETVTPSLPA
jgi:amidohydrolase